VDWTGSAIGLGSQSLNGAKNANINHSAIHHRKPICQNQSCLVNTSLQVRSLIDIQRRKLFAVPPVRYCVPLQTVHIKWGVGSCVTANEMQAEDAGAKHTNANTEIMR